MDGLANPIKHRGQKEIWKTKFPSLKRVTSRGKKYVYLRRTGAALVRGFMGTDEELEELLESQDIANLAGAPVVPIRGRLHLWRIGAARGIHKTTKNRAATKGRTYSLSVETIAQMLKDAGDRCQVTGLQFDYYNNANPDWRTNPLGPSLDRVSNKGGYDAENVRLVCTSVNYAINEFGLDHFDKICRAYVERNPK
ncbi:hypothetical protein [Bradyrhizobium sp. LVM 105]|uniref:hypothetical protein n=1 Tax=Bradyrhizobium sp. LVM 105 TaxID=2341115 RepID=UPI000F80A8E1|nr:hypothetical protein [Bradyrhizobium sp. LVM 105]RTE91929.1 hypothetical protein D6B98_16075 [Bradyrhizobium sp. LVM 105]